MQFYENMQQIATGLLTEFNQPIIKLISIQPGNGPSYNPGPSREVAHVLTGAVARGASFKYVTGGLAQASDLQVTMSVRSDVTPSDDDMVEINGERYKVVSIIQKPASGTPVVYTLIVRGVG